jgi:hypothetical protein
MAKRGRPRGTLSWARNLPNVAAHHASILMELWLADVPVLEIRYLLLSLAGSAEHQALIEECWRARENERRFTVPPTIKRKLCRLAIAHVMNIRRYNILQRHLAAEETRLRTQGWSNSQIAEIRSRSGAERIDLEPLDLNKVVEIVNRRAPRTTLRRKAAARKLREQIRP